MSSQNIDAKGPINPDLAKERECSTVDVQSMKAFLGEMIYFTREEYDQAMRYRDKMVQQIKPIFYENFYNLDRDAKYQMVFKKSLDIMEFVKEHNCEHLVTMYTVGHIMGPEKFLFSLHVTMFLDAIDVWSTSEQREYWKNMLKHNAIFATYVQTEIGHGTYLRGLETTATYDKSTQEFVIDSPTLTSIKFWPGGAAHSCNYAIVMAKLVLDGQEHGIHAFIVQLRSLENHKVVPGLELGDIGRKFGFDSTDNAYLKFNKLRIPRSHMLMRFARVTPDGKFERLRSELLMYAAMLLMRGTLCLYGPFFLTISSTIAIRYSCVRRQTVNAQGVEQQVINYQTQQYRLFPALAATYALSFAGWTFRRILITYQKKTNDFKNITSEVLAQLHAVSAGLKSVSFGDCLKFAQSNRLCCGGHGYSASSGLGQIIQEADAGSTYEGDNIVLLLQTARFLLKCTQKGIVPHLELANLDELKSTSLYKNFESYFNVFFRLYEESINEVTSKIMKLIREDNLPELEAWNRCSSQLIIAARIYIDIFVIFANLHCIHSNPVMANRKALSELFELYVLYEITDVYSGSILRFNVLDLNVFNEWKEKLLNLLPVIRVNAVALVDSFGMQDANLCSSLGAYDGNAYERLFDFAQQSQFNEKKVHDVYEKYLKPYAVRHKQKSKL